MDVTVVQLNGSALVGGYSPSTAISTVHKVVYKGILSCSSGSFKSIIYFYWILQCVGGGGGEKERLLGQITSTSATCGH